MNLMSAPAVFDPPPSSSVRVGRPWLSGLAADSAYVLTGWVVAVISSRYWSRCSRRDRHAGRGRGLPVLVLALFVAQGFAVLERARLRTLTGRPGAGAGVPPVSGGSVTRRVLATLADAGAGWTCCSAWFVLVPSVLVFPIGLAWWCAALTGVLYRSTTGPCRRPDGVSLPNWSAPGTRRRPGRPGLRYRAGPRRSPCRW